MDFPCVQWQDHVAQKWIGLDPQLKDTLTSQPEIDDLFKCALTLTTWVANVSFSEQSEKQGPFFLNNFTAFADNNMANMSDGLHNSSSNKQTHIKLSYPAASRRFFLTLLHFRFIVKMIWASWSRFLWDTAHKRTQSWQPNAERGATPASRAETTLQPLCTIHRSNEHIIIIIIMLPHMQLKLQWSTGSWQRPVFNRVNCNYNIMLMQFGVLCTNIHLLCVLSWQGICFAPQGSDQLSLCYANRSAALHHLQHHQVPHSYTMCCTIGGIKTRFLFKFDIYLQDRPSLSANSVCQEAALGPQYIEDDSQ